MPPDTLFPDFPFFEGQKLCVDERRLSPLIFLRTRT